MVVVLCVFGHAMQLSTIRLYVFLLLMLANLALMTSEEPKRLCFTAGVPATLLLFIGKTSHMLMTPQLVNFERVLLRYSDL